MLLDLRSLWEQSGQLLNDETVCISLIVQLLPGITLALWDGRVPVTPVGPVGVAMAQPTKADIPLTVVDALTIPLTRITC